MRIYVPQLTQTYKVMVLGDTHLHLDDERGVPYKEYSARMAKAYNKTRHFQSGARNGPQRVPRRSPLLFGTPFSTPLIFWESSRDISTNPR